MMIGSMSAPCSTGDGPFAVLVPAYSDEEVTEAKERSALFSIADASKFALSGRMRRNFTTPSTKSSRGETSWMS